MTSGRQQSLRTHLEIVLAILTAILLATIAIVLVVVRYRDQKRLLENAARMFAQTTTGTICQQYQLYYHSGSYKFRDTIRRTLALNPDIHRVLILSVEGMVLYDSEENPNYNIEPTPGVRTLDDHRFTAAAAILTPSVFHGRDPGLGHLLMIVSPYVEDWGRHSYSVLYVFTYASLTAAMKRMILPVAGEILLSIVLVIIVARWLGGRIVKPIEVLISGVREIEDGKQPRPIVIHTSDEIETLADSFNRMSARLEAHVQELERANRELQTLDRMKTDLLANISHELRTPLSAVRGYVEVMKEGALGPVADEQSRALNVCLRNLDRLNSNINMLLDFSKMELGHLTLKIVPCRLSPILELAAAALRPEAGRKGLALETRVPPDCPIVMADRDRLLQIIENLLTNAIKFTPAGGRIEASATPLDNGRSVEICVEDNGIGIPDEQKAHIFDKFFQVESGAARRFGGVGLGLAIVKTIVEAHHSNISVEDRPGGGTVFRFRLPAADRRRSSSGVVLPAPASGAAHGSARILTVDDDPEFLNYLEESLRPEGYEILRASSVVEGLRLAKSSRPALILLDIYLPDADGFSMLEQLKQNPQTRDIPAILLTVLNNRREGFRLGADDYLLKPVEHDLLLDAVGRALRAKSEEHPPHILVIDDEPDIRRLLAEILTQRGYQVTTSSSGADGLAQIEKNRPALILLDIMMPEMTGWDVLRRLREGPNHDVPVIVLSARESATAMREVERLGARSFVGKSAGYSRLLLEIRSVLKTPSSTENAS